jgi:hypothetical protein
MHYVTHGSHGTKKHKFGVTCPSALFDKSVLLPPEHEKQCADVSCSACTEMHYVSRRSHLMQKQMFDVMCPGVLFMETAPGPLEHE